ncbi:MAG: aldose 1-epimerase family protein [Bacteroidia bacterium]
MHALDNGHLSLRIHPQGAELHSLRYRDTEYLWQGDPAIWARRAPVLFPFVGRLKDDRYFYEGQSYPMGQHGFARDRVFTLAQETADSIAFVLHDDAQTRERYPFAFAFEVRYSLHDNTLRTTYTVHNPGTGTLPFSLGAHPGFRVPLFPGEALTDYRIVFDQPLHAERHLLDYGLFDGRTEVVLDGSDEIPLTQTLFDRDALVFHELPATAVSLVSAQRGVCLRMSLAGFPFLGIWAKPGAPFVCLEPWQGLADSTDHSGDLLEKPGLRLLRGGETHQCSFDITLY